MTETSEQPQGEVLVGIDGGVDVDDEIRRGRVWGAIALVSIVLTLASVVLASRDPGRGTGDVNLLTTIGHSGNGQLFAMIARVVGIACLLPFALFLQRAIRERNVAAVTFTPILGIVGLLAFGIALAVGFFEVRDIAREFVASGPQTGKRASALLDDSSVDRIVHIVQIVAQIAIGIWISITSFEAMRVGLMTRFLGVFGLATGFVQAIGLPPASALLIAWVGSLGLLAVGYWPGGRPPAWDEGRAVSFDEQQRREIAQRGERTSEL